MNKKKREEVKTLLSVLPKSEVRNILVAGDKPWKAVAIMGLFVSAIYACAAANAFYNNYPSDWVFYNMGTLAAISLVPISIKTKNAAKQKQLYLSMINQLQIQISQTHSAIIKKIKTNLDYLLAIAMDKQPEVQDQEPSREKFVDKSDLVLNMKNKSYKKMLLEIRKFNSNNSR